MFYEKVTYFQSLFQNFLLPLKSNRIEDWKADLKVFSLSDRCLKIKEFNNLTEIDRKEYWYKTVLNLGSAKLDRVTLPFSLWYDFSKLARIVWHRTSEYKM